LKILLVGDYPNDPRLGSAKVPYKLAEEFRELGHTCDLLFAPDLGRRPTSMHARFVCGPWLAARAIRRAWRRNGPYDVIDVASGEGLAVPWLRAAGKIDRSTVFISRSNGLEHMNYQRMLDDHAAGLLHKPWYKRWWYPLTRLQQVAAAARWADRMITINDADRQYVIDLGWRTGDNVATIGHGVSSRFLTTTPRNNTRGGGILFCGTWTGMKGVDYLTAAFSGLIDSGVDAHLTILGGSVPEAQIRASFSNAARDRLRIVDRLPEEQVMQEYARHDLLVFPSTYEGFGMVVPEAMSQELPVVATPVGCACTVIRHGENGLLIPARDSAALQFSMQRLLADSALRQRLGVAARRSVQELTWNSAARRTLTLYCEAIVARTEPVTLRLEKDFAAGDCSTR